MDSTKETNQLIRQRLDKVEELRLAGHNPYPNDFRPTHQIKSILPLERELMPESGDPHPFVYTIAGRIVGMRSFGKAAFLHIQDETGRLQVYVQRDRVGEDAYRLFKKWDTGDIAGFSGRMFKTKTGELTLQAESISLVTKCTRPLPEKFHGLTDIETRYRQRYVDLIVNPEVRATFRKRVEIIRLVREFLNNRGFLEVETPMMQAVPSGATARPFRTHHNALGMDLFLRVAPELCLKRLLVGGFEKVYEINRNFRNEGLSTRHNPEFTMLEFYQAYASFEDFMQLTEELVSGLAVEICGSMQIPYQGQTVNVAPPWARYSMDEALERVAGLSPALLADTPALLRLCAEKNIALPPGAGAGKAKSELFELLVEERLIDPTFITAYPTEISPLARRSAENPEVTERFELFITGREMANAFNELNDPVDQHSRFARQIAERGEDPEIHPVMDEDYVRALEYGMPPAAGEGIGIDRLVMLLTDAPSIRDVILFPHLKPETR